MRHDKEALRPFFHGLPWLPDSWPRLLRLPPALARSLGRAIRSLATNLSGARLRFTVKGAPRVLVTARHSRAGKYDNFSNLGQRGIDVFVDGHYWDTFFHPRRVDGTIELGDREAHVVELYLPIYGGLKDISVEARDGAILSMAPPFSLGGKPVVFYGSSITQGGCASRPSLTYTSQTCRRLGLDQVNLGFSGNGFGHLEIARLIASTPSLDPCLVVLDWGANLLKQNPHLFKERYEKFYSIVREGWPRVPVIMVNLQHFIDERRERGVASYIEGFREHVRAVHEAARAAGDPNLWLFEAGDIVTIDNIGMTTCDGKHPNDVGFKLYADALERFIKEHGILEKNPK